MGKTFEYENIIEIAHTDNKAKANSYLKLNWVMLNVESNQYSEHGWNTSFVFGWPKANGEVKHPEKSEFEILMESSDSDETIPF